MSIDVTMPKLSDTMEEGKIIRWVKHQGDPVAIGDVLAEVETDKANMELEAYDEGTLSEVRVGEGESAPVGAVIAVLAAPGDKAAKSAKQQKPSPARSAPKPAADGRPADTASARGETAATAGDDADEEIQEAAGDESGGAADEAGTPAPAPREEKPAAKATEKTARTAPPAERSGDAGREPWRPTVVRRPEGAEPVRASPLAKRIARERGIDLRSVRGSGPDGRIVEKDVEAVAGDQQRSAPERPAAPAASRPTAKPAEPRGQAPVRRLDLSRLRRTTAKRMGEAKREIPHFYASAEIAMDEAIRMKEGLAALGGDYQGITFTHFVLKAAGLALVRVPEVNASYDGDSLILHDEVNVGMATAVDDGLIVPVVHHCDREPLAVIVRQARGLVERARTGHFAGDDLSGGTFTVSNLGMFPVIDFAAIINPPQAAILAVGTIRDVAAVRAGHVVAGRAMTVTLSCDHRVIDGVLAGRFLRELKTILEQPFVLLA